MKIFDVHMHSFCTSPADPQGLISSMETAGVYGACVYSDSPKGYYSRKGAEFEERLENVFEWCHGYEDRLFPVLWIHPDERSIKKKVRLAAERGIVAFKIIPCDHHADSKKSLRLMHEIAELGKPVIFHSGILWDATSSAKYLHPQSYEGLLTVPNLRFALAHCSWPWIDECIAMFGKINHTHRTYGKSAEMFLDLTPGAHGIYRRMLFERLHGDVYDITNHTMFGVDATTNSYNVDYVKRTLETDLELYRELGVSEDVQKRIFCDNFFRFLGLPQPE